MTYNTEMLIVVIYFIFTPDDCHYKSYHEKSLETINKSNPTIYFTYVGRIRGNQFSTVLGNYFNM